MNRITTAIRMKNIVNDTIEVLLVLAFSGLIAVTFFSERRATTFEFIFLGVLLIQRFTVHYVPRRSFPKSLIIWTLLYLLSCFVGALLSADRYWELTEFRRYIHIFLAGLLFTAFMEDETRKILIMILFTAALIAGFLGILQYYGLMNLEGARPRGLTPHPILYAAMLAFACGSAVIMFLFEKNELHQSKTERLFLLFVVIFTLGGILVSGSRGVWIALIIASIITLFLYNRRKAFLFTLLILIVFAVVLSFSNVFKQRVTSIVTSIYTEDEKGSTGIRMELWKGSLLILKKHPLLGVGTGNYQSSIEALIQEKKIKEISVKMHAHSIYFQVLATRGIIGLIITIGLFVTLMAWGVGETKCDGGMGGYVIILCTMLTIVGGLTENNIESNKFLAVCCLTIGLIGPISNPTPINYFLNADSVKA